MPYYTERHEMRSPIHKTYNISLDAYELLFDCCDKYLINIAQRFPAECPDGCGCCGIDHKKIDLHLKYRIPNLFRNAEGEISKPRINKGFWGEADTVDEYDQFSLLDYIEFIAENCKGVIKGSFHSYFQHNHYTFTDSDSPFHSFQKDINDIFEMTGLQYFLTDKKVVERVDDNSILTHQMEHILNLTREKGTRDLIQESIALHKSPHPESAKYAVQKIWDAFERLKTYYPDLSKKDSANKIIENISGTAPEFKEIIADEFRRLTDIGNNYRIRHHETNRIEITDIRHYDYLFNRCLAIIALSIQYLLWES